jgi:predicted short-subunit dehydrogenase-like oxidoreductase (DUF2520 family)
MSGFRVAIIGAGRMGQGLGVALIHGGAMVAIVSRSLRPVVPPLVLHTGTRADAVRGAEFVLLATPDDVIGLVAARLAEDSAVGPRHIVLHLSGLLDRRALAPLEETGAGLGSFHPLQTVADPATAPERLAGAYAGIEGDARARAGGERLAGALRMTPVFLEPAAKPAYHAAATFAANYTVAVAGVAERVALTAGIAPELAARMYRPLLEGAVANLRLGPAAALTGPVRRGDLATIQAHLAVLQPPDRRLYCELGLAALELARAGGLGEELASRVEELLAPGARLIDPPPAPRMVRRS